MVFSPKINLLLNHYLNISKRSEILLEVLLSKCSSHEQTSQLRPCLSRLENDPGSALLGALSEEPNARSAPCALQSRHGHKSESSSEREREIEIDIEFVRERERD